MIDKAGKVKLGDFGSAIFVTEKKNGIFSNEGFTQWYKAPELLFGSRSYDQMLDMWGIGCIFGELINGFPVFPGKLL